MNRRKFLAWLGLAPAVAPKVVEAATKERYASGGMVGALRNPSLVGETITPRKFEPMTMTLEVGEGFEAKLKRLATLCRRESGMPRAVGDPLAGEPELTARSRRPCPRRRGVLRKQLKPALRRQS